MKDKTMSEPLGAGSESGYVIEKGVLRVPMSFNFGGSVNVGAAQIGEALIALDSAVRVAPPVLAKAAGVKIRRKAKPYCAVRVDELRRGSLCERLLIDVAMGGDEQAREFVKGILQHCQSGDPATVSAVVGAIIIALVTGGAVWAIKRYSKKHKEDKAMINAHNSVVVYAAGKLNIAGTAFRDMLASVVKRPSFARDSVRALRPGLDAAGGGLTVVSGGESFNVGPEAFSELPTEEELEASETSLEHKLENVELTILASDLQRNRQGWAAQLPEGHAYSGVRIRLEVDDAIPLSDLMYKQRIVCDGVLHLVVNHKDNTFRPIKIVVSALKDSRGQAT